MKMLYLINILLQDIQKRFPTIVPANLNEKIKVPYSIGRYNYIGPHLIDTEIFNDPSAAEEAIQTKRLPYGCHSPFKRVNQSKYPEQAIINLWNTGVSLRTLLEDNFTLSYENFQNISQEVRLSLFRFANNENSFIPKVIEERTYQLAKLYLNFLQLLYENLALLNNEPTVAYITGYSLHGLNIEVTLKESIIKLQTCIKQYEAACPANRSPTLELMKRNDMYRAQIKEIINKYIDAEPISLQVYIESFSQLVNKLKQSRALNIVDFIEKTQHLLTTIKSNIINIATLKMGAEEDKQKIELIIKAIKQDDALPDSFIIFTPHIDSNIERQFLLGKAPVEALFKEINVKKNLLEFAQHTPQTINEKLESLHSLQVKLEQCAAIIQEFYDQKAKLKCLYDFVSAKYQPILNNKLIYTPDKAYARSIFSLSSCLRDRMLIEDDLLDEARRKLVDLTSYKGSLIILQEEFLIRCERLEKIKSDCEKEKQNFLAKYELPVLTEYSNIEEIISIYNYHIALIQSNIVSYKNEITLIKKDKRSIDEDIKELELLLIAEDDSSPLENHYNKCVVTQAELTEKIKAYQIDSASINNEYYAKKKALKQNILSNCALASHCNSIAAIREKYADTNNNILQLKKQLSKVNSAIDHLNELNYRIHKSVNLFLTPEEYAIFSEAMGWRHDDANDICLVTDRKWRSILLTATGRKIDALNSLPQLITNRLDTLKNEANNIMSQHQYLNKRAHQQKSATNFIQAQIASIIEHHSTELKLLENQVKAREFKLRTLKIKQERLRSKLLLQAGWIKMKTHEKKLHMQISAVAEELKKILGEAAELIDRIHHCKNKWLATDAEQTRHKFFDEYKQDVNALSNNLNLLEQQYKGWFVKIEDLAKKIPSNQRRLNKALEDCSLLDSRLSTQINQTKTLLNTKHYEIMQTEIHEVKIKHQWQENLNYSLRQIKLDLYNDYFGKLYINGSLTESRTNIYLRQRHNHYYIKDFLSSSASLFLCCFKFKSDAQERKEYIDNLKKATRRYKESTDATSLLQIINLGLIKFKPRSLNGLAYRNSLHYLLSSMKERINSIEDSHKMLRSEIDLPQSFIHKPPSL